MNQNEKYMHRALELARRGLGSTSPNPPVGAVIVKAGRIIGEGYHRKAGTPHAEVHALRMAVKETKGKIGKGAALFVTLEPCNHYGRTPPCTEVIIASGIKHVVIGTRDPNPHVLGKGIRKLRASGIQVEVGILSQACSELIRPFAHWLQTGRPFVTCKAALTLDGNIATARGESQWITGAACRRYVHQLRDEHDVMLVGARTVMKDNPRLTIRKNSHEKTKPVVVVESRMEFSSHAHLFSRAPHQLIIATTKYAPRSRIAWGQKKGFEILICRESKGRVVLVDLLFQLGGRGVTSLFVEGGGEIFSSLIKAKMINRFVLCYAPKFLGGAARSLFPHLSIPQLAMAPQLKNVQHRVYGDDIVIEGEVVYSKE
ncbi:MAG: riboflavin biosynthesis protein RibD [Deltaproteobacteria bacterium RIFCSPLOWO2_02_FULL_44_10]|nr:MAG: riboflavin biosynthesis protein RibD [Deltaproteobacteria bacterium RIFCSPHIGHO2_02_FULL_44_16]OGQ46051.1 MAG: riboflavin biosynthesis protein RibD [Deltaproteobacteria bacterium RIFCSPLOWO2_02_FULL_44_10]